MCWRWWHSCVIAMSLTIIAILVYSDHTLNGDEGVVLNAAWQLWHGKTMYLDFADFTAPGSAYTVYWSWLLFSGPSYLVAKCASLIMLGCASVVLACFVHHSTHNRYLTYLTAASWMIIARFYPLMNHNTYSSLVAAITLIVLLQAIQSHRLVWYGIAGVCTSLVIWYLQTKGLIVLVLCLITVLAYKKYLASLIFFCSAVMSLGVLLWPWPLKQLWYSWFALPMASNYLNHTIIVWSVLAIQCIFLVILGYVVLCHSIKFGYPLLFWQAGLWLSSGYLIDVSHLLINSFPALLIVILWLDQLSHNKHYVIYGVVLPNTIIGVTALVFCVFNLATGNNIFQLDIMRQPIQSWKIFWELGQQAKGIYAGPFLPSVYFELKQPNPFTAAHNMVLCNAACQAETVKTLQQVQPEYVFLNYAVVEKYHYQAIQPIDRYIRQHYYRCAKPQWGSTQLYSRNTCP